MTIKVATLPITMSQSMTMDNMRKEIKIVLLQFSIIKLGNLNNFLQILLVGVNRCQYQFEFVLKIAPTKSNRPNYFSIVKLTESHDQIMGPHLILGVHFNYIYHHKLFYF